MVKLPREYKKSTSVLVGIIFRLAISALLVNYLVTGAAPGVIGVAYGYVAITLIALLLELLTFADGSNKLDRYYDALVRGRLPAADRSKAEAFYKLVATVSGAMNRPKWLSFLSHMASLVLIIGLFAVSTFASVLFGILAVLAIFLYYVIKGIIDKSADTGDKMADLLAGKTD